MKVESKYVFHFYPDTSDLDPKFVNVKGAAKDMAAAELAYMLEHGDITVEDFDFKVIDDHDDHKLPDDAQ